MHTESETPEFCNTNSSIQASGRWRKLFEEHDWLVMLVPGGYDQNRDLRTSKWLICMGKLFHFMLGATFLAQIIFTDDGRCQGYTTEGSCTAPKGVDGIAKLVFTRECDRGRGRTEAAESIVAALAQCGSPLSTSSACGERRMGARATTRRLQEA